MKYIIDTNVPVKASDTAPKTDKLEALCSLKCMKFMQGFLADDSIDLLVLDFGSEIYNEYKENIQSYGQDNIASVFVRWVQRNLTLRVGSRIEQANLTKKVDGYDEFPNVPELESFDPKDKKFIALANVSPSKPTVVEGADSNWWPYRDALKTAGIPIMFLCEEYIRAKYEEKH